MTTTHRDRAPTEQYLRAHHALSTATATLHAKRSKLELALAANDRWHADMSRLRRSGKPIISNAEALRRGSGAGFEILYRGDPRQPPYSDDHLGELEKELTAAEQALSQARAQLDRITPVDRDLWDGDHRYVYWPEARYTNPDSHRYRGQPVSAEELRQLGAAELQRALTQGRILERPIATI